MSGALKKGNIFIFLNCIMSTKSQWR